MLDMSLSQAEDEHFLYSHLRSQNQFQWEGRNDKV